MVMAAQRQALESEQIGNEILTNLADQRETIHYAPRAPELLLVLHLRQSLTILKLHGRRSYLSISYSRRGVFNYIMMKIHYIEQDETETREGK